MTGIRSNISKCPLDFSNSILYSPPWLVPMFCVGNPDTEYPSVPGENDLPLSAKIDTKFLRALAAGPARTTKNAETHPKYCEGR